MMRGAKLVTMDARLLKAFPKYTSGAICRRRFDRSATCRCGRSAAYRFGRRITFESSAASVFGEAGRRNRGDTVQRCPPSVITVTVFLL